MLKGFHFGLMQVFVGAVDPFEFVGVEAGKNFNQECVHISLEGSLDR